VTLSLTEAAMRKTLIAVVAGFALLAGSACFASPFTFSTGSPDGRMAMASRPDSVAGIEIEAADDFTLATSTAISGATFTGLVTGTMPSIGTVGVEIYRVFPLDSNTTRTPAVPTRTNSPSDVAFESLGAGDFTFTTTTLAGSFAAANSVLNGIFPAPSQTTGGDGAVSGQELEFALTFAMPLSLPAGHYFFVPQVQVTGGQFYWLSAAGPTAATDLQAWIRNANLDPDWLRVGTDIVGGASPPRFNASFALVGDAAALPEPGTLALLLVAALAVASARAKRVEWKRVQS
jgi:hypothetical protein